MTAVRAVRLDRLQRSCLLFFLQLGSFAPVQVRVLNEAESSSSASVFRAWDQRLERPATSLVSNDDDPELLVHVPFTGTVKIKAISVIGGTDGAAPSNLRVFVNREDLDFAAVADMPPVQAWELQENLRGDLEYPTQYV